MRRRYIQIDGKLVEVTHDFVQQPQGEGLLVMGDIQPFRSMLDGSIIEGRRQKRDHYRAHQVIEVGNETKYLKPKGPIKPPPGTKEILIREVNRAREAQRNGRKYEPH